MFLDSVLGLQLRISRDLVVELSRIKTSFICSDVLQ